MQNDLGLFGQPTQPWDVVPTVLEQENSVYRDQLLTRLANSDLGQVESKVARILQKYPETRDDDVELALRFWREYEAATIAAWQRLDLHVLHDLQNIGTIVRCRQRIQNDYGLFIGTRRTRYNRSELQMEFYRYLAEKRDTDPETVFYIDETGSEPQGRFVGVGGMCVLDSRSYDMRHAALRQWRRELNHPMPLHFADYSSSQQPVYLELLRQLERYRSGLMFVGYAMTARTSKLDAVARLIVQMVGDAMLVADKHGCVGSTRAVTVIKEAAEGFDALYLDLINQELSQHLMALFPGRVYLKGVFPVGKQREVLLECADVIAASMKRRWESGNAIHKDRLAEAVVNLTGFDDPVDTGMLYKMYQ